MKQKHLTRSLVKRLEAMVLSVVMVLSVIALPVKAEEQEGMEITEEVIAELVTPESEETKTVSLNEDGAGEYMADQHFMDVYEEDNADFKEYLSKISSALDSLEEEKMLFLEISVTVTDYTPIEGKTAQLVAYSMNNTKNWQQNQKDIIGTDQTCNLSLSLEKYENEPVDFLGMRVINCENQSEVKYTIHYAKVVKKDKPQKTEGKELATLVEAGTKKTGVGGDNNNEWGTDYNGKNIYDEKFGGIPHLLKWGLDGFSALELKVSITVDSYSAELNQNEDGTKGNPSLVFYIMDSQYGNWKQDMAYIEKQGQTVELSLDLIEWGQTYIGEFGVRFGGFDPGKDINYTINYAKVVGEGEGSTAPKIDVNYPLTGTVKMVPMSDTPVGQHGKLSVTKIDKYAAPTIVDKNGDPYQLRGASTHGLAWFPEYVNKGAFQSLRDEWGMNMIRIAVYAREGGYTTGAAEAARDDALIQKGVQAATELGMYVIIDWHVLNYNPNEDIEAATAFFKKYSEMYKDYDNVLFEVCNEPTNTQWYDGTGNDLYTYCKKMTQLIRGIGSDAIVICGTNQYSSQIDKVAEKPLSVDGISNVMYTYHFYAATHYADEQEKVKAALEGGTPVFISEYGVCNASGNGAYDLENSEKWLNLCDDYNVSYACWAMSNSEESAAYFVEECEKKEGGWLVDDLKNTGRFLVNYYRARQEELHEERETRNQKEATCKEAGYTGDIYCKICGKLLKQGNVIAKKEHTWNQGVVTTAATETKDGVKTYTCTVCKMTRTEKIPATGKQTTTPPANNNEKTVPKKGSVLKSGKNSYKVTKAGSTVAFAKTTSTSSTITVPATVKISGITYKVTSIAANAFKNNKKVTKVKIGSNVTSIGNYAFSSCKKLKTVTIGKKVTSIGTGAFKNCIALTKITVPSKVTSIGASAFSGCKKLTTVSISTGLKKIGKEAFKDCTKLKTITIKSTKLKSVGKNAFKNIKSTAKIKVPSKKLSAYKRLLKGKGQGSKVKITK